VKDISIVILNWNGISYLEKFLPGVVQHANGARVILADNASTDDSVVFTQTNFPSVEIIRNEINGGFAKGYNDALKHVQSKYYLLLNSDIEVTENWLEPLYELIESNPNIAGVQPKILSFKKPNYFEHAGASGGYLDRNYFPFCRGRIFATEEADKGQYESVSEVFWATGAAMLIRSDVFHSLGGFDESFFAHMEEIDLCWRAKNQGYSFMVEPKSKVYHVGGGTLSYMSPRKTYLNFRNSLYMIVKNHQGILYPRLFVRMCYDGIAGVRFLFKGEISNLIAVLNSHFAMYGNLRTLLAKRKTLKQHISNPNKNGFYTGNIVWAYYFKGVKEFAKLNQRLFITDRNPD